MTEARDDRSASDIPRLGTDVFISYAREDRRFVGRLHDAFAQGGQQAWVDWEGIPASAKWMAEVRAAIDASDAFLFVISPDSVESSVCREEAAHAAASNKRIVPLLHKEVEEGLVPESVAAHNWIDFTDQASFDEAFETLARAIATDPEWVRIHTKLLVRAKEWDQAGRDRSRQLRGSDLSEAEGWLAAAEGKDPPPSAIQTAYLLSSRKAATRRQRTGIAAVAAVLVLSLVLSSVALLQRNAALRNEARAQEQQALAEEQRTVAEERAAESRSRELAAASVGQIEIDPELSLLLAIEAMGAAETPEAVEALRLALTESLVRASFAGHEGPVIVTEYGPEGERILTGSYDGTARIWDQDSMEDPLVLRGHSDLIEAASFSPDGSSVVTASYDGTARIWDAVAGAEAFVLVGHDGAVHDAAFSPDGSLVVIAGGDGTAIVWDAATGERVHVLEGHGGPVYDVEFDPAGRRIVTASEDGTARIWEAGSGRQLLVLRGHQGELNAGLFSDDGALVLTAGIDGTARVWDAANGTSIAVLRGHDGPVVTAAFSPDGSHVLTGGVDGTARMWQAGSGRVVYEGRVSSAVPSPDGTKVAVATNDGRVVIIDVETGAELLNVAAGSPQILAVLTADGEYVASAGYDGVGHVWDVTTGKPVAELDGHTPSWTAPDPLSTSDSVLTYSDDGTARLWDPATGAELALFDHGVAGGVGIWEAHLSDDGDRVVTTGTLDGIVRIWDAATGEMLWEIDGLFSGFAGIRADLSPDGELVAVVSAYAGTWDVATGRRVAVLESPDLIRGAVFSPDARTLATWSDDGVIRTWDPRSGRLQTVVSRDARTLNALSFSPDGRFLIAADEDGPLRVWDPASGDPVATIDAARGMWFGSFAGDTTMVSNDGGSVRVDGCAACGTLEELLEIAGTRVTRTLSVEERFGYLGDPTSQPADEQPRAAGLRDADGGPVLDGLLPPGRYTAAGFAPELTFEIREGWYASTDIGWAGPGEVQPAITVFLQQVDDSSASITFVHLEPGRLVDMRKDWDERRSIVPFPNDLVTWFRDRPHYIVRPQGSLTIDGVAGEIVGIEVTSIPENHPLTCPGCVPSLPITLKNETGPLANDLFFANSRGNVERWIVFRTPAGTILVMISGDSQRAFDAFLPLAEEILSSVTIG